MLKSGSQALPGDPTFAQGFTRLRVAFAKASNLGALVTARLNAGFAATPSACLAESG